MAFRHVPCSWLTLSPSSRQKKALASDLYEQVLYTLDVIEKDYFGLQFTDHNNVKHWLDPTKTIKKQIKIGPPYTLHLKVKFYSSEPNTLREELTRYQFFLQLKQDIVTGRLEVPEPIIQELCALSLQCELNERPSGEPINLTISLSHFQLNSAITIRRTTRLLPFPNSVLCRIRPKSWKS
jgi:FERM N-terminal domain/FERM central domain